MQLNELYPSIMKKQKDSDEIFICGYLTYAINI